ncbi:MAG: ATP-binding protein [Acidobacteriota bacterium]|nr:ATP-binding protein [Acidobacteriota bacterium]
MIVAIASGKGGTGKTTVAVNLALSLPGEIQLLDCDVEAPNAHLFLETALATREIVGIPVPEIDADRCNQCAECSRICQYHAIAVLGTGVMVFPELCHGCGGCTLVCPEEAIREVRRPIGVVEKLRAGNIELVQGRLNIGEALVPPLIREVRAKTRDGGTVLIDAPPGTSCSMIAAVRGSDFVILVTEPTPFGLNDLGLAVETVRTLGLPCGVVINRAGSGDDRVHDYCAAEGLEILLEIPDDRRIAEAYSRGRTLVGSVPEVRPLFLSLAEQIQDLATAVPELQAEKGRARVCG